MRDKRPVDELSVEELEHIIAIKRREERQQSMKRMQRSGRVIETVSPAIPDPTSAEIYEPESISPAPAGVPAGHDPVAAALAALTQPVMPQSVAAPTTTSAPPAPTVPGSPRFEDAADRPAPIHRPGAVRQRRRVFDRLLLLVEVSAVLMIVVIAVNLVQAIGTLEKETASAQQLADENRRLTIPTVAPTPTIRLENVVLPGGHIFGANPQFNYNEVPEFLRARVQSEWIQPVISRPPQTSETALALIVPKLNLNATIVQGVDWEALKQGVGQVTNGINPGDDYGNVSMAAHNDIYGKLFQHLDELAAGDSFQIQTRTNVYTYTINSIQIVEPNKVDVLEPREGATATLISCYPYQVDDQRIVVFADRIN